MAAHGRPFFPHALSVGLIVSTGCQPSDKPSREGSPESSPKEETGGTDTEGGDHFEEAGNPTPITGAYLTAYRDPPLGGEVVEVVPIYVVIRDREGVPLPIPTKVTQAVIEFADQANPSLTGEVNGKPHVPYHVSFAIPPSVLNSTGGSKDQLSGVIRVEIESSPDPMETTDVIWLANLALQGERSDYGTVVVPPVGTPIPTIRINVVVAGQGDLVQNARLIGLEGALRVAGGSCPPMSLDTPGVIATDCDVDLTPIGIARFDQILTLTYFNGLRQAHASWIVRGETAAIVGQPDGESSAVQPVAQTSVTPANAWSDGTRLYVADTAGGRVLIWSQVPSTSLMPADVVLGQADFASVAAPDGEVDGRTIRSPTWVQSDGETVFVADDVLDRVLIWNAVPTSNFAPASHVVGQPSPTNIPGDAPPVTARTFKPAAVAAAGGQLLVSDLANDRILIWNQVPSNDYAPADLVLGQSSLTSYDPMQVTSSSSQFGPGGLFFDGVKLYATNRWDHRVVIWNSAPPSNNVAADLVLGQPDFSSTGANVGGIGKASLSFPKSVHAGGSRLTVADSVNSRVLLWRTLPSIDHAPADEVLGQVDEFGSSTNALGISADSLNNPGSAMTANGKLIIADTGNNRVIIRPVPGEFRGPFIDVPEAYDEGEAATGILTIDGGEWFNFGPVPVGDSRSQEFLLRYSGTESVQILGADGLDETFFFAGGAFPGEGGTCGIAINASCAMRIGFRADVVGVFQATIKVRYESGAEVREVMLVLTAAARRMADVVLGKPGFTSGFEGAEVSSRGLGTPAAVHGDGTRLVVTDPLAKRVLIWESLADISTYSGASVVVGMPDSSATSAGEGITARTLQDPSRAVLYSSKLFVADSGTHRVLIWNAIPSSDFAPANIVIGQPNLSSSGAGIGSRRLNRPLDVHFDGSRLYVADCSNGRVLVWNSIPTVNHAPADLVIGQPNMDDVATDGEPMRLLKCPVAVTVVGGRLFIIDKGGAAPQGRVLVWNTLPTIDYQAADFQLGSGGETTATSYTRPGGLASDGTNFYVADSSNHRVLVWRSVPTSGDQDAELVYGQFDLTSGRANAGGIGAWSLSDPRAVYPAGAWVFVADAGNGRVLRFPAP